MAGVTDILDWVSDAGYAGIEIVTTRSGSSALPDCSAQPQVAAATGMLRTVAGGFTIQTVSPADGLWRHRLLRARAPPGTRRAANPARDDARRKLTAIICRPTTSVGSA